MHEADSVCGVCGAYGGHKTAGVRNDRRIDRGRGLRGGPGKEEWMRCLLDGLRAFIINADQWTFAVQGEGGWCKTKQGAAFSTAKLIAAEKVRAGLRRAVACLNVMGGTKKFIAQSTPTHHAGSLAIVD